MSPYPLSQSLGIKSKGIFLSASTERTCLVFPFERKQKKKGEKSAQSRTDKEVGVGAERFGRISVCAGVQEKKKGKQNGVGWRPCN